MIEKHIMFLVSHCFRCVFLIYIKCHHFPFIAVNLPLKQFLSERKVRYDIFFIKNNNPI